MKTVKQYVESGRGVKFGDEMVISSIGEKKRVHLNRTRYLLTSSQDDKIHLDGNKIKLATYGMRDFQAQLVLDQRYRSTDEGIYYMEVLEGGPVLYNGKLCFKFYLDRDDLVEISYLSLDFSKEVSKNDIFTAIPKRVVESDLNILIHGESGVGKSYLARKIHDKSEKKGHFVQVNLSSFSHGLIESELFGHVKGAFTGAIRSKEGAIAQAECGTLFIDEVDTLPLDLQVKLLLFLDSKKYRRVGDDREALSDCRLLFACNRPLEELVRKGVFRKDLYFRITSGHSHHIAPLRGQHDLIKSLLDQFCKKNRLSYCKNLLEVYLDYLWPGNVRQFLGHLEKKKHMTNKRMLEVCVEDLKLSQNISELSLDMNLGMVSLEKYSRLYVQQVFYHLGKNRELAAKVLKISPNTVKKKVSRISREKAS